MLYTILMPQPGSVLGDVLETVKHEAGNVAKEVGGGVVKSINILEGLDPVNPGEVAEKSKMFKEKDKAELAAKRRSLHQEVEAMRTAPRPQEQPQQGAQIAEKAQSNQMANMNNQSASQLSAGITPKKKLEPLVVQQKRNNKLHGAG